MKKIKMFMLISFLSLFCGCTVDYNIIFKKNHRMDETVIIKETGTYIKNSGFTISEVVNSKIESYSSDININGFTVENKSDDNNIIIVLKSKNKSVGKLEKFMYFGSMFNGVDEKREGSNYSFKTNGKYDQSGLFYDPAGIADEGFVDQININIQFQNKVISHNADKVDQDKNIYTWVLTRKTIEKTIEFELSDQLNEYVTKEVLKEKEEKNPISPIKKKKVTTKDIIFFVLGCIFIVGTIIFLLFFKKEKENN